MDIRALLTFVANHVEQIFGTTLVLFFLTSLLLLIRSIGRERVAVEGTTASVDPASIEEAVRRALGTTPIRVAETTSSTESPVLGLEQQLQERDARIKELQKEIEVVRTQIANATAGGGSTGAGISDAELAELRSKLEQMEARLAEYEIIEDDIADLSLYKEENARLKAELDALRKTSSETSPVVEATPAKAAVEATPEPAAAEIDPLREEFAAAVLSEKAPPSEVASGLPLDPEALASMKAAVEEAPAAPAEETPADDLLSGSPDTEKMLSEISALGATNTEADNGLSEELDTEKLLAEVDNLGNLGNPDKPKPPEPEGNDLLAEFAGNPNGTPSKG